MPSTTINRLCGSGLKAVALAAQAIRAGDAEVMVAGGMESMSGVPHLLPNARRHQMGSAELVDSMINDGLDAPPAEYHMGATAENSPRATPSPLEQDDFALRSQQRAPRPSRRVFDAESRRSSVPGGTAT